jgi:nucleotide-binding universal stress UspA family protein
MSEYYAVAESPGCRHVLVSYEASADGRAALSHAEEIARAAGARLTVLAVAPREPVVGCASCRQSAVLWNRELGLIASEELEEATSLLGSSAAVEYRVARGERAHAIADAASEGGADLIVLPWQRPRRVRRPFAQDVTERLRQRGGWQVVVAAPARGARGMPDSAGVAEPAAPSASR